MARRRFAVALMIPPPVALEIDGVRRALGDAQLGRVEPHITLVPPINLRDEELTDALTIVDAAAAGREVLELTLGPVTTFDRDSPVRFLAVAPWEPVVELHDACWTGVLERTRKRDFVPHVTVDIDGGPVGTDDPAVGLLSHYEATVLIDRVTVLEHDPAQRRWEVYNSYRFG